MRNAYVIYLALWALFLISVQKVHSQRGDFALGVVPSYKADGYGIQINLNYSHSTTDHVQASIIAAFSKEQPNSGVEFPYHDYLLNIGYFTTVLTSPKRGLFIFFGGGPSIRYEYINNGEPEFRFDALKAESGFIYGGFASFELDFFISDAFSLIVPINGYYHINSDLNNSMLLLGVGIRYYLK